MIGIAYIHFMNGIGQPHTQELEGEEKIRGWGYETYVQYSATWFY